MLDGLYMPPKPAVIIRPAPPAISRPARPRVVLPGLSVPPTAAFLLSPPAFIKAQAGGATVAFTGKSGSSDNRSAYTGVNAISVACGSGGDMVVASFCQGLGGPPAVSSWSLDSQTITSKSTEDDGSETAIAIGTCSGVSSGTNDFEITWSISVLRCMVFVWRVTGVDLVTMTQAISADALSLTFVAFDPGTVVIAAAGTASTSAFTGATGITWDDQQFNEIYMTGGHDLSADASTSVSFTGTADRPVSVGLELGAV